jgi:glycosyltransferase involved in cell wall biosynthesis
MKLTVIIPVYNENQQFLELLDRVESVPVSKEIIVVDDGSTNTLFKDIGEQLAKRDLIFLQHTTNHGKGAAICTALSHASGEVVIIQDADQEYFPEDYALLLQAYTKNKVDAVYGVRDLKGRSPVMFYGNKFVTLLTNLLYGGKLHDMETCYKLIRRDVFKGLKLQSRRFDIEAEITAKLLLLRTKIVEVPIRYESRQEGKKLTAWDGIPTVAALIKCLRWKPDAE